MPQRRGLEVQETMELHFFLNIIMINVLMVKKTLMLHMQMIIGILHVGFMIIINGNHIQCLIGLKGIKNHGMT